ncbi:hypothetical protein CRUP_021813 [Coryphaenoides rupestris]|nr:hypothetical protein CRUP_021813 [Coryphaenoides rupestris]
MWAEEDHSSRSFTRSRNESSFSRTSSTRSFKPTGLFALAADMDLWDNMCLFESQQSSAQSGMGAVSGLGLLSKTCTVGFGHTLPSAMRPWMPMSHLAPEDVPSFFSDPPRLGGELHSALGEWGSRRTGGLAHRLLQEAQQRLGDNLQQQAHDERPRQPGKPQYNRETSTTELHEQEKPCPDTALLREALTSVKEVNETLRSELRTVKQSLEMSQAQLCELRAERDVHTQQVLAQEEAIGVKAQESQKLESERLRGTEELRAMASFWNEKWQEAVRSLSSTQRQLEAVKRQSATNSLLRVELDACKQQLELEKNRSKELWVTVKELADQQGEPHPSQKEAWPPYLKEGEEEDEDEEEVEETQGEQG